MEVGWELVTIMPPRISRFTQPQVGLNCDDVADWLHANNPEMYFFVSFCNFGGAAACGGFVNGGSGGGADILDDHEENDVERIPTRDVKCIADAPDFIAPEVNFTFGASNLNKLNFKDLPVFQRYMLQNAIVIMKVTKRNCKNFGKGKKLICTIFFPTNLDLLSNSNIETAMTIFISSRSGTLTTAAGIG